MGSTQAKYIGTCYSSACFSPGGWQDVTGEFSSYGFTETKLYHEPGYTETVEQNQYLGLRFISMIVTATYLDLVHLYQDWSVSFVFLWGKIFYFIFFLKKNYGKKTIPTLSQY